MKRSILLACLALAGCATPPPPAPPPPLQPVTLDLDDPVVIADIAGVTMRLRIDFTQKDVIELNPAAAARLPVTWENGFDVVVGRIVLRGRQARAAVTIDGLPLEAVIAEHGRDCCAGVDGAISPAVLPYDPVRLVRHDGGGGRVRDLAATISDSWGLTLAQPLGREELRVRLALDQPGPVATAAAGAILAREYGGQFEGPVFQVKAAFGVGRQARLMRFARPATVAGFPLATIAVRFADFSGGRTLPVEEGTIEVRGRGPAAQRDWPAVTLGRDSLDRCREIVFRRAARTVTLDCREAG